MFYSRNAVWFISILVFTVGRLCLFCCFVVCFVYAILPLCGVSYNAIALIINTKVSFTSQFHPLLKTTIAKEWKRMLQAYCPNLKFCTQLQSC